jgi:hypothetical protein
MFGSGIVLMRLIACAVLRWFVVMLHVVQILFQVLNCILMSHCFHICVAFKTLQLGNTNADVVRSKRLSV